MSRSHRKTPKGGITTAKSEKEDKRFANRKERRKVKIVLQITPEAEILPHRREISNPWVMAKDGKHYYDCNIDEKYLRK